MSGTISDYPATESAELGTRTREIPINVSDDANRGYAAGFEAGLTDTGMPDSTGRPIDSGGRRRHVLSAGTLAGDRVRNTAGEDLGKIEEIMIDLQSGRVAYAVLSFGGFLGIGDKLFAVPWKALTINEDDHEFVLDVDKQVLENAPGFDKDNWPDMADPSFSEQIHGHWNRDRVIAGGSNSGEPV